MAVGSHEVAARIAQAGREQTASLYLNYLDLGAVPEAVGSLINLARLDLNNNQLTALPEALGNLTNLSGLYLRRNRLTALPEALGNLTNLTELYLSDNQLTALPDWLGNLTNLTRLDLNGNQLTTLPEALGNLTNLTRLDLRSNQLTSVPEALGNLTNLTELCLNDNQLNALPEALGSLRRLIRLDLNGNRLTALPETLGNLTNLTELNLNDNQLNALPETLGNLTNLTELNVNDNQLTALPKALGNLRHLILLYLNDNPLVSPPPEIVASGTTAVLAFLRDRATSATVRLWASKLLVVGEATVGKTSLAKQLTSGVYDPDEPQTHGATVYPLPLAHPTEPDTMMSLTLWDFGGQLEYRATQRFYLTDRSLFVLVWNARARWRDGKILAWLDVITARAPESPILVVATHGDEPSAAMLPDDLPTRYPRVVGVYTVDAKSGRGIDEVREAIRQHSAALPLMGVSWPKSWVDAARAVREQDGYAATAKQAWDAMAREGVADPESRRAIARALHDLGEVVFFADDRELGQKLILRPQWLDERITAVLDSGAVAAERGVLTRAERDRLWDDLDDPDLSDRLVRMMERFDLAYRIGDEYSEDVALVVERLGDARPPRVNQLWDQALEQPGVREIGLVYKLKSRQAGIPTWFIARQHRYTTGLHWTHGVLFHDRDPQHPAYALLVDDEREQPTITLRVRGRYPVHFLSVLAESFEDIAERRYRALIEQRLVPCACQGTANPRCTPRVRLGRVDRRGHRYRPRGRPQGALPALHTQDRRPSHARRPARQRHQYADRPTPAHPGRSAQHPETHRCAPTGDPQRHPRPARPSHPGRCALSQHLLR